MDSLYVREDVNFMTLANDFTVEGTIQVVGYKLTLFGHFVMVFLILFGVLFAYVIAQQIKKQLQELEK